MSVRLSHPHIHIHPDTHTLTCTHAHIHMHTVLDQNKLGKDEEIGRCMFRITDILAAGMSIRVCVRVCEGA